MRVEERDGWPLLHVRSASRATEIVAIDPHPDDVPTIAAHVAGDPRAMATILTADLAPFLAASLPDGARVDRDDETFMSTRLCPRGLSLPPGYRTRWSPDARRMRYSVEDGESVAAEGLVGVWGDVAVLDGIETSSRHRRRGLAAHVTDALCGWAASEGASTGVLAASPEGRRLYTALGWEPRLAMWSLMGAGPQPGDGAYPRPAPPPVPMATTTPRASASPEAPASSP